jgi:hypothetical protein
LHLRIRHGIHAHVPFAMPGDRLHRNALQLGVDKQIHPRGHS